MLKEKENKEGQLTVNTEKKFLCKDRDYFSMGYAVRNIDFMETFGDETARSFISQVRAYSKLMAENNTPEENSDIYVYINSKGGVVTALLAMIDAMALVPNDFVTVCIGQCASCGAVFLSCGTKGKRYITENSRVLIHQVSSGMWGKNSEIQADAKEADRLNKLLLSILAKNCGKTVEELEKLTLGGDLILTAEEAVEFGIVDAILTKDVIDRMNSGDDVYLMDGEGNEDEENNSVQGRCKPKEGKSAGIYETTALKLEVKSINEDEDNYHIKGIASTPDIDRVNDIVEPSALMESVKRIGLPAFVHQHNLKDMPLGVCVNVSQNGGETIVDLKMPKDDYSEKIKRRIDMGAYQGLSIGYVAKDKKRNAEGYRVIKALDWYEVSLVTVPANPNAKVLQVKNQKTQEFLECDIMQDIKTVRDVENLLIGVGCTKKEAGYVISVVKSSKGDPEGDEGKGEPSQENAEDIQALVELRNALKK